MQYQCLKLIPSTKPETFNKFLDLVTLALLDPVDLFKFDDPDHIQQSKYVD